MKQRVHKHPLFHSQTRLQAESSCNGGEHRNDYFEDFTPHTFVFVFHKNLFDVGTLRAIVGTLRAALKPNVIANPDVARYDPTLVNNINQSNPHHLLPFHFHLFSQAFSPPSCRSAP